jgi:hypothetical protein
MSITYPLQLPSNRQIARVRLTSTDIVAISQSPFSGAQQVYQYTGQFWEADVTLRPMNRDEAEYWISFLLKLNGSFGTFLLGDPNGRTPRGVATGSPLVFGGNQSGNVLETDGWTANTIGILKAGDYIQLGSSATARLYKVLNDVNSDSSGRATLDIYPKLRTSPADNALITTQNTVSVFRLNSNQSSWDITEAQIYGITFGAKEVL